MKKVYWIYASIILLFVVDRLSKILALKVIPAEGIYIIKDVTGITLEMNQGIAYSISLPNIWLVIIVIVFVLILMFFFINTYRKKEYIFSYALFLIVVGAISNLIDRINYGYVVDMIVLTTWPVFNLADVFIILGAIWLIFLYRKSLTRNFKADNLN